MSDEEKEVLSLVLRLTEEAKRHPRAHMGLRISAEKIRRIAQGLVEQSESVEITDFAIMCAIVGAYS